MSKKLFTLFTLFVGVVFVLSMSLAVSAANLVDIDQVGTINNADVLQSGVNQTITDIQNAGATNNFTAIQDTGLNHNITNNQTAGGNNDATIIEEDGGATSGKNVSNNQNAGLNNHAGVDMSLAGDATNLVINQNADLMGGSNIADATIGGLSNAGSNTVINQSAPLGSNVLGITENLDYSDAVVSELNLSQLTAGSMNEAYINSSTALAGGPNLLTDALPTGTIGAPGNSAMQISMSGDNYLNWYCDGGDNAFGLYQNSPGNNTVNVEQPNGSNSLGCWQVGPGNNTLDALQGGGMSATIVQNALVGDNIATIWQP